MLIALVIFGVLSTIGVSALFFGLLLPESGVKRLRIVVAPPPEEVWTVVADHTREPQWRKDLLATRRLPDDPSGREVWLEERRQGDPLSLTTLVHAPPAAGQPGLLARRTMLERFRVDVVWEIEVAAAPASRADATAGRGSHVTLTVHARTQSPLARLMSAAPGADRIPRLYLTMLARALGEEPRFVSAPRLESTPRIASVARRPANPIS